MVRRWVTAAATRPAARRPGTDCGCLPCGTRSPAAGEVQAGAAERAGSPPATGWRSRKADHGRWGSYGSAYRSSTSSMLATKLTLGMHQLLPRLENVFLALTHSLVGMEDASPSSTTLPASRRRVQWRGPPALDCLNAMRWARSGRPTSDAG